MGNLPARIVRVALSAKRWLDHLGSCSPCYSDFSDFRRAYESRRKRTLLAIAASILVVACIGGWFLLQRHNEGLVAQTALLDLRNRSLPRGTEPNPPEPPLVLNRAARHWIKRRKAFSKLIGFSFVFFRNLAPIASHMAPKEF